MAIAFLQAWRDARGRQALARRYVTSLMAEPADDLVRDLAAAGDRDDDHARWELRYARRALGLVTAERDALDDQTSADVAAALTEAWRRDPNVAADRRAVADRQLNERLTAYRAALGDRLSPMPAAQRAGRLLLQYAGASAPFDNAMPFATRVTSGLLDELNGALRRVYGEATLPPDVRPSEIQEKTR